MTRAVIISGILALGWSQTFFSDTIEISFEAGTPLHE